MATFIPGYLVGVLVGTDQLESITASGTLTLEKNMLPKPVGGEKSVAVIAGQRTGSVDMQGHISTEDIAKLWAAYDNDAPIAFEWQVGEAAGPTDAGKFTGSFLVESLVPSWSADGQHEFSLSGPTTGDVAYDPPGP